MPRLCSSLLLSLVIASAASAVTIDWTLVGDPGNAADFGYGSVAYSYNISTYEVTNAQYAEFLNAVADPDTYGLYNPNMGSVAVYHGGITRSGNLGNLTYSAIAGREDMPVNSVSFYDALRFANWLHNGQPTGAQDVTTTEDGAYTITQAGINDNTITRNPGATVVLPSEDEWYKAAYYNALSSSYFVYPARSNTQTVCAPPTASPNHANCYSGNPTVNLTTVGSYPGSVSPYGTFDQGGNVWEWNETNVSGSPPSAGPYRGLRAGGFNQDASALASWFRVVEYPSIEQGNIGIRVVPEPGRDLLLKAGTLVLGLAGWRRARA